MTMASAAEGRRLIRRHMDAMSKVDTLRESRGGSGSMKNFPMTSALLGQCLEAREAFAASGDDVVGGDAGPQQPGNYFQSSTTHEQLNQSPRSEEDKSNASSSSSKSRPFNVITLSPRVEGGGMFAKLFGKKKKPADEEETIALSPAELEMYVVLRSMRNGFSMKKQDHIKVAQSLSLAAEKTKEEQRMREPKQETEEDEGESVFLPHGAYLRLPPGEIAQFLIMRELAEEEMLGEFLDDDFLTSPLRSLNHFTDYDLELELEDLEGEEMDRRREFGEEDQWPEEPKRDYEDEEAQLRELEEMLS